MYVVYKNFHNEANNFYPIVFIKYFLFYLKNVGINR